MFPTEWKPVVGRKATQKECDKMCLATFFVLYYEKGENSGIQEFAMSSKIGYNILVNEKQIH